MKKLIILFAAVFSIFFTGCEIDNFSAPESMLTGTVTYNGNAVGVRTNGTQLELWQDGYALNEKIAVHIAQDGTYSARLFNGEYKMVRLAGAPWDAESSDTIVINVSGNTVQDVEVQPFFTVTDASFEVKGNAVVATFKVNQVDVAAVLQDVKLYLSKNILVDENQKDFALKADVSTIVSGEEVTMIATLPQILDAEYYYFARVGVRSDQSSEFYYSQVEELQGDPDGPKNPTADFTSVVNGREVTFTTTSKYVESFMWDFGDGDTSTEENPTHTYAQGGDYTVTLTAMGGEGTITAVATHSVNVGYVAVPMTNGNFELSTGGNRIQNWADVLGWNSDSPTTDSGVENLGTWWGAGNESFKGVLYNVDASGYNITDHIVLDGEIFKMNLEAINIWNGPKITVSIISQASNGTRNVIKSQTFDVVSNEWTSIELVGTATATSVGGKLGVEFKGVSGDGADSWTSFDNVELFAK
ncbi:DUF3823 domain-containing protein [Mangrovibacterium diazotrophicum]|uniref:PKD domain-containing protein n=1 Tax=Mangrovibacterium diazotrophicum TaxID=1261403 RepID=A0A419W625_9BACT|nr:DUF3823 domain-containing protein [Mangrovibacterium diazotrophicum]RKD90909.1 PKD domain-containing protein [Mangrovibacterium diazotrophicum]